MSENRKAEVGEHPSANMCFSLSLTMSSLSRIVAWTHLSVPPHSHTRRKGQSLHACLL